MDMAADWKTEMAELQAAFQAVETELDALKAEALPVIAERDALKAENAKLVTELEEYRSLPFVELTGDTIVRVVTAASDDKERV